MTENAEDILKKEAWNQYEVESLLGLSDSFFENSVYPYAKQIKDKYIGPNVYYRGLIELSNICSKDCYYCGLRKGNTHLNRYKVTFDEVLEAAKKAISYGYGSICIQAGEISSPSFVEEITSIIVEIKKLPEYNLGITLSLGEQSFSTYKKWFEAGAHRYLLRVETSNINLYKKIHPDTLEHSFENRVQCLKDLRMIGYQVGSGMMVGLPSQTLSDIAEDLCFLRDIDIDMCGLGPFIEHPQTPFAKPLNILPLEDRLKLAFRSIALLRIIMKDINIASATALQAIDPEGREKALMVGTNIIMPNLTPRKYRSDYTLYKNKPCVDEEAFMCRGCLEGRIKKFHHNIGYNEWGDSPHFKNRILKK